MSEKISLDSSEIKSLFMDFSIRVPTNDSLLRNKSTEQPRSFSSSDFRRHNVNKLI